MENYSNNVPHVQKSQELESIKHKLKMVSKNSKSNKLTVDDYISNIMGSGLNISKPVNRKSKLESQSFQNISHKSNDVLHVSSTMNLTNTSDTHFNHTSNPSTSSIQNDFYNSLPVLYRELIEQVKISSNSIELDSQKVYQVLLMSGLSNETLAVIWNNVNRTLPGQLTMLEFSVALAMVGYCQKSMSHNSIASPPTWDYVVSNGQFLIPQLNDPSVFVSANNNIDCSKPKSTSLINSIDQLSQFQKTPISHSDEKTKDTSTNNILPDSNNDWADFTAFDDVIDQNESINSFFQPVDLNLSCPSTEVSRKVLKQESDTKSQPNLHIVDDSFEADFGDFQNFSSANDDVGQINDWNKCSNDLEILPTKKDSFIDKYQVFTEDTKSPNDNIMDQWMICVSCCLDILTNIVRLIKKVDENKSIDEDNRERIKFEIFNSDKGQTMLSGLIEVYRVTKNIKLSSVKMNMLISSKSLMSLLSDIEQTWNQFIILVPEDMQIDIQNRLSRSGLYNNQQQDNGSPSQTSCNERTILCSVCLCPVQSDVSSNAGFLTHGLHHYHCPCANLWVNCLNLTLPGLASYTPVELLTNYNNN